MLYVKISIHYQTMSLYVKISIHYQVMLYVKISIHYQAMSLYVKISIHCQIMSSFVKIQIHYQTMCLVSDESSACWISIRQTRCPMMTSSLSVVRQYLTVDQGLHIAGCMHRPRLQLLIWSGLLRDICWSPTFSGRSADLISAEIYWHVMSVICLPQSFVGMFRSWSIPHWNVDIFRDSDMLTDDLSSSERWWLTALLHGPLQSYHTGRLRCRGHQLLSTLPPALVRIKHFKNDHRSLIELGKCCNYPRW